MRKIIILLLMLIIGCNLSFASVSKRLSIDEQSMDGKGIFMPLEAKAGILINNVVLSQIFFHNKLKIDVYFVDPQKYPQFYLNIEKYAQNLMWEYDNRQQEYEKNMSNYDCNNSRLYVFSNMQDLYFLRELPQHNSEYINQVLINLKPVIYFTYSSKLPNKINILTKNGYKIKQSKIYSYEAFSNFRYME